MEIITEITQELALILDLKAILFVVKSNDFSSLVPKRNSLG
jgi:hypothetical protein